jgi:hypothetical protein
LSTKNPSWTIASGPSSRCHRAWWSHRVAVVVMLPDVCMESNSDIVCPKSNSDVHMELILMVDMCLSRLACRLWRLAYCLLSLWWSQNRTRSSRSSRTGSRDNSMCMLDAQSFNVLITLICLLRFDVMMAHIYACCPYVCTCP